MMWSLPLLSPFYNASSRGGDGRGPGYFPKLPAGLGVTGEGRGLEVPTKDQN